MRRTFIDDEQQLHFEKFGYVVINQFLDIEEIEKLRAQYFSLENDLGVGFHATMHSADIEYRRKVSQIISEVFTSKANQYLLDYTPLVSNFTIKEPGKESFFDFHLDWNMVDETKCKSVTIWCALEDTNEQNGNLWILEKSHLLGNSYRCGPGLALYFENIKELKSKKFKKKSLPMKAGDVIIYDHKLFHGSPPNMSNKPRLAINQAMRPTDFKSIHYTSDNSGNIIEKEVDDDYYNRCIINYNDIEGTVIRKFKTNTKATSQKQINKLIYKKRENYAFIFKTKI